MLGNLIENQLSPEIGQQVSHWDMAGFSPDTANNTGGGSNSGCGLESSNINDNNSHSNPVTSMDY